MHNVRTYDLLARLLLAVTVVTVWWRLDASDSGPILILLVLYIFCERQKRKLSSQGSPSEVQKLENSL